ncbi:MAG: D-amino acid aminotransferase [Pseudomonadales bacterium]
MDVYLNGAFTEAGEARISPMDRGFLFADGAYEVIPAFNGRSFGFDAHIARLQRSLDALQIDNPHTTAQWQALCNELMVRNGGGDIAVYLQITRGAPAFRDQGFPAPPVAATVFMTTYPIPRTAIHAPDTAAGGAAILVDDVRWSRCDIKSVALLANVLCRQQAANAGAVEAIQVRDGMITEGSATNVFMVKDGAVATPPRSHRILAGVTRQIVIDLCADLKMPASEREIPREELLAADEVWITSSSKDALPIVTLEGRPVGDGKPGPVWKTLAGAYAALKRSMCGGVS